MEDMKGSESAREIPSPEDVLRKVAEYSRPYMDEYPRDFSDGTFGHGGKLHLDKEGQIVLVRYANKESELVGDPATPEQMKAAAFEDAAYGTGALSTSADVESWKLQRPMYGIYKIPAEEFIELARQHKLIIGNEWEREIVLSGDIGKKYLKAVFVKDEDSGKYKQLTSSQEQEFPISKDRF